MDEMSLEDVLKSIKELKAAKISISPEEYWAEVNKIAKEEDKAFEAERKKLQMPDNILHRRFTI